jgi:uncharacterized membrane protein SirB2
MYLTVKTIHITAAILSISGFVLRGTWMLRQSPLLEKKIVRVLPHIVDTLFLLSGIWLVWLLRLDVLEQSWLIAKLVALVAYVILGVIALRRGRTLRVRSVALVMAVLTFAYISGVAMSKSVASWLAWTF